jgi:hypothetical protein
MVEVSPGRLTEVQRNYLMSEALLFMKNNPDPIAACKIPRDLYSPAIALVGGFNNQGQLLSYAFLQR